MYMRCVFAVDCHQLPEHCVLARIWRAQQLNDLSIERIVSLHSHLSKCFGDEPHLRFVVTLQHYCQCIFEYQADVLLSVLKLLPLLCSNRPVVESFPILCIKFIAVEVELFYWQSYWLNIGEHYEM